MVTIKITKTYFDVSLNRKVRKGEVLEVSKERAELIVNAGFATVVKIINVPEQEVQKKVDEGFEKAKKLKVQSTEVSAENVEEKPKAPKRKTPAKKKK